MVSEEEIEAIIGELYCSMFEHIIEDRMLINFSQKVIARDSKLSVRSVAPFTRTQVNFLNGNQFFGDMNECRMTGSGRYLWADDGSFYEGEFNRLNVIEGRGTFKFRNREKATGSSKYSGSFLDGKFNGKGQLTNYFFSYSGDFADDKFQGRGSIKSGNESFDGCFELDKKVCGKRVYADGTFVGEFDCDEMRSFGKYEFGNGDVYCGSFENGLFAGFGEYTWKLQDKFECKYIGFWRLNYRDGLGIMKVDGITCIALFRKNVKEGPAVVWAKNGRIYASNKMFHRDEFLGCVEVNIEKENVKVLRKLMNVEEVHPECFKSIVKCLVENRETSDNSAGFPFHMNWFDLKADHESIWQFVKNFPDVDKKQEFSSIAQTVKEFGNLFEEVYLRYARFSSSAAGSMLRIGLWQLMRDLEIYKKSATFNTQEILEAADDEFHILSINPDDPFEVVSVSSLVQYLMYLTLHVNKHHDYVLSCAINQRSKIFGLFATMLVIFLREFIQPLMSLQTFNGMIPKLIQDDQMFLTNFFNIIDRKFQKLSIRSVFETVVLWKGELQTIGIQRSFLLIN